MIQIIIHYIQERWFEGYGPMGHFVGLYGALRRTLLQRNLPSMANLYVTKLERSNYKNLAMPLQRLQGTKKESFLLTHILINFDRSFFMFDALS